MGAYQVFENFRNALKKHFDEHMAQYPLFEVAADREEMWSLYLESFPPEVNPIFRKRRVFDCSECRSFIKKFGNVVAITESGEVISIWDFDDVSVAREMSKFIHSKPVTRPFMADTAKIGVMKNRELGDIDGDAGSEGGFYQTVWHHFYVELPDQHVVRKSKIGYETGERLNARNALKNTLEGTSVDAIDTVLDMIRENVLYRGGEWEKTLEQFREVHEQYDRLDSEEARDIFCWRVGYEMVKTAIPFIRNRSIGTLLTDISEGRDIEEAVRAYEAITAPDVYKRPKPIFTTKMKQQAKEKIVELGFETALNRRFAALDDITVNDILFADRRAKAILSGVDEIFDTLQSSSGGSKKGTLFDGIPVVTAAEFVSGILPTAEGIEAYVDNAHSANFVSLIAPCDISSKSMFTWGNGFSWAYTGNGTDSFKKRVQEFGGKVDGDMRFSIQWNESGRDSVDLDAHCQCMYVGALLNHQFKKTTRRSFDEEIYFGHKRSYYGGELDIDIRWPNVQITGSNKTAIENITWNSGVKPRAGEYTFYVHQYDGNLVDGFKAEIELRGEIFNFVYPGAVRKGGKVVVAVVRVDEQGKMSINPQLPFASSKSKKVWGIDTLEFHPVTAIMYSPNHWSTAEHPCGHKHLFFMLEGCQSDEHPSGIFNEYLVSELSVGNRKVMSALSDQLRVQDTDGEQLSGLGFALDKRAELIVKVHSGENAKVMKVTF